MSECHVKRLMRVRLAENPDAWATIASYPDVDVAADRIRGWHCTADGTMDDAYDPSIWVIEEWKEDELMETWRVTTDGDVLSNATFTEVFA